MAAFGSPEYALTWKHWAMTSGPPICALRASARRTSDNASSGWPTPKANERDQSPEAHAKGFYSLKEAATLRALPTPVANADAPNTGSNCVNGPTLLGEAAALTMPLSGWHSPKAADATGTVPIGGEARQRDLRADASLAGWNTPRATDGSKGGPNQTGETLCQHAHLAGWPTPKVVEAVSLLGTRKSAKFKPGLTLTDAPHLSGWATPTTRDAKDGACQTADVPVNGLLGRQAPMLALEPGTDTTSSPAATEKRGALNPELSRWLMGYPAAWGCCGATAMQSCRNSRRSSSRRSSTRKRKAGEK
jgi:hypothetical protein